MTAGALTKPRFVLGQALKRLRIQSRKTLDEVAAVTGKSRARMINILDGRGTLTAQELDTLLDFFHVAGDVRIELQALGAEARKRPRPRPHTDMLPGTFEHLADLESIATEISCYEPVVIPGLLQIERYVEEIMAAGDGIWWASSDREIAHRIAFRLERQKRVMDCSSRRFRFVISEEALLTQVGGPATMATQLATIVSIMDDPNISVRVLPKYSRHNLSLGAGLTLLRFDATSSPPAVAMLPVLYGPSIYLDDPEETGRLSSAFGKIEELAMGQDASRQLIAGLAERPISGSGT
jgi:transcriptional regulator with XRE-family HTH domain